MTSVAPPPPPPPLPPAGNGAAQLTVSLPPHAGVEVSKLAIDSLISGLVKQPGPQGETVLQTSLGQLQFKAPFILPPGSQATFKLVQTVPNVQIQLTSLNGKALPPNTTAARVTILASQTSPATQNIHSGSNQTSTGVLNNAVTPTSTPNSFAQLNTASGIRAFVLAPAQAGTLTPGSNSSQQNALSLGSQTGKAGPSSSQQPASPNQVVSPNKPSTTSNTNPTAQAGGKPIQIQQGFQLNVRLLSVQLPGQIQTSLGQASAAATPNSIITQGTVQGQTAQAQPIIKIPQGLIALDTNAKMPEGSQIRLEILSSSKADISGGDKIFAPKEGDFEKIGQKWPALDEALSQLRNTNPLLAETLSQNIMPKPDSRLAVNLIFFLKALGRGSFKDWADDKTIRALAKSSPETLKRLESDFEKISQKHKNANSTDWKIAYIPLQDNNEIHQIRIAQRDHKEDEKNGKDELDIRFVIDLHFSKFGAMQLDCLAKNKAKKFDLILRTHNALPAFVRKGIHDIYSNGMAAIHFEGKLSFQVTPNFVDVESISSKSAELNLGMLV